jgi:hypothetical protein
MFQVLRVALARRPLQRSGRQFWTAPGNRHFPAWSRRMVLPADLHRTGCATACDNAALVHAQATGDAQVVSLEWAGLGRADSQPCRPDPLLQNWCGSAVMPFAASRLAGRGCSVGARMSATLDGFHTSNLDFGLGDLQVGAITGVIAAPTWRY